MNASNLRVEDEGTAMRGALWMCGLSVLLCWLPFVGGFVAGIVGGRMAGGLGRALVAWLLSSLLIGVLFATLGTAFTGLFFIGVIVGLGGFLYALVDSGGRLLGAIVGGLIA